jgi:hypothetical protein
MANRPSPTRLTLDRSKKYDPVPFWGEGWKVKKQLPSSTATRKEIDLAAVEMDFVGKHFDELTSGRVWLKRHVKGKKLGLDAQLLEMLYADQSLIPKSWRLISEVNDFVGIFIYFPGTILTNPENGDDYVPYLNWHNRREWRKNAMWLDEEFHRSNCFAVLP